jgi:hypothetical protein
MGIAALAATRSRSNLLDAVGDVSVVVPSVEASWSLLETDAFRRLFCDFFDDDDDDDGVVVVVVGGGVGGMNASGTSVHFATGRCNAAAAGAGAGGEGGGTGWLQYGGTGMVDVIGTTGHTDAPELLSGIDALGIDTRGRFGDGSSSLSSMYNCDVGEPLEA